jgi:5-methyltetrahydropteroyltriglutamate--homocysteine methyltransferase
MKRSTDRILVYHAGALAKPADIRELVNAKEEGQAYDRDLLKRRLKESVADLVQRQIDCGIDFINDGEQSKSGFSYYIHSRLGGIEERKVGPNEGVLQMDASARDRAEFPEYYAMRGGGRGPAQRRLFFVTGPLTYTAQETIATDIENLRAAVQGKTYAEAILPCVAPGSIEHWQRRGLSLRDCGRDARGVQGHNRRGLHRADRRPGLASCLAARGRNRPELDR